MSNRFRKFVALMIVIAVMTMILSGCNRVVIDTHWRFSRAIISLGNGITIEGKVSSWKDFDNGDEVQVTIDGKTYLTSYENVLLIDE